MSQELHLFFNNWMGAHATKFIVLKFDQYLRRGGMLSNINRMIAILWIKKGMVFKIILCVNTKRTQENHQVFDEDVQHVLGLKHLEVDSL